MWLRRDCQRAHSNFTLFLCLCPCNIYGSMILELRRFVASAFWIDEILEQTKLFQLCETVSLTIDLRNSEIRSGHRSCNFSLERKREEWTIFSINFNGKKFHFSRFRPREKLHDRCPGHNGTVPLRVSWEPLSQMKDYDLITNWDFNLVWEELEITLIRAAGIIGPFGAVIIIKCARWEYFSRVWCIWVTSLYAASSGYEGDRKDHLSTFSSPTNDAPIRRSLRFSPGM